MLKSLIKKLNCTKDPITNVYFHSNYKEIVCFQGLNIFFVFIGMLCAGFFTCIAIICSLNLYESRTNSRNLFSRSNSYGEVSMLVVKIIFQLSFTAFRSQWVLVLIFFGGSLISFIFNVFNRSYFHKSVLRMNFVANFIFLWTSLNLFAMMLLFKTNYSGEFVIWIFGLPFCCLMAIGFADLEEDLKANIKLNSETQLEENLRQLLIFISRQNDDREFFLELSSYILTHLEFCKDKKCSLSFCKRDRFRLIDPIENEHLILNFIEETYKSGIKKYKHSAKLRISYASFLTDYMGMGKKAIEELVMAQIEVLSFEQQFLIYRQKKIIEDMNTEIDSKDKKKKNSPKVDVVAAIALESYSKMCIDMIKEVAELNKTFWSELLKTQPDLQEILEIGIKMEKNCLKIQENWDKLGNLSVSHFLLIKLFWKYTSNLKNDKKETLNLKTKLDELVKEMLALKKEDFSDLNHLQNYDAIVISLFTPKHNGRIKKVNDYFLIMFEFSQEELKMKYLDSIIPDLYKTIAKKPFSFWIKKLHEIPEYLGKEKDYYVKRKSGTIFQTICVSRLFQSYTLASQENIFVTMIKTNNSFDFSSKIMVNKRGKILNLNRAARMHFQFNSSQVGQNMPNIHQLIPEVMFSPINRLTGFSKEVALPLNQNSNAIVKIEPIFTELKYHSKSDHTVLDENHKLLGFMIKLEFIDEKKKRIFFQYDKSENDVFTSSNFMNIWDFIKPELAHVKKDFVLKEGRRKSFVQKKSSFLKNFFDMDIKTKRLVNKKFIDLNVEKKYSIHTEDPSENSQLEEILNSEENLSVKKMEDSIFFKDLKRMEENEQKTQTILHENVVELILKKKKQNWLHRLIQLVSIVAFMVNILLIFLIYFDKTKGVYELKTKSDNFSTKLSMLSLISELTANVYQLKNKMRQLNASQNSTEVYAIIKSINELSGSLNFEMTSFFSSFPKKFMNNSALSSLDAFSPKGIQTFYNITLKNKLNLNSQNLTNVSNESTALSTDKILPTPNVPKIFKNLQSLLQKLVSTNEYINKNLDFYTEDMVK